MYYYIFLRIVIDSLWNECSFTKHLHLHGKRKGYVRTENIIYYEYIIKTYYI